MYVHLCSQPNIFPALSFFTRPSVLLFMFERGEIWQVMDTSSSLVDEISIQFQQPTSSYGIEFSQPLSNVLKCEDREVQVSIGILAYWYTA